MAGMPSADVPAPVTSPAPGVTDVDQFTIGPLEVPIPSDATSAVVTATETPAITVAITTPEPPSTTDPASADPPAPATPVEASPDFTG